MIPAAKKAADELIDAVQNVFIPYEYSPENFHEDTFEWQVESAVSKSVPTEEPNWFEVDQVVTFRYVKEVEDLDVDVLESFDTDIRTTR